jgi:hypothetical protein
MLRPETYRRRALWHARREPRPLASERNARRLGSPAACARSDFRLPVARRAIFRPPLPAARREREIRQGTTSSPGPQKQISESCVFSLC